MTYKLLTLSSILALLFVTGCSNSTETQSLQRPALDSLPQDIGSNAGTDVYEDSNPSGDTATAPDSSTDASQTSKDADDLFADQKANINCVGAGELAMEYSLLAEQQGTSAAITDVLDTRLEEDWSQSVTVPVGDERAPVLRCWARVRWSIGWDSDVDLWLLLDSERNIRVRWDNIQNAEETANNEL